jgi:hypothetical protein
MSRSISHPDPTGEGPPGEPESWLLRFGGALGAGALGALIAAMPATLRIESLGETCSRGGTWALLSAVTIVPMSTAIVGLRRARTGLVALGKRHSIALATTSVLWLASTFVSLTALGSLLRALTHHRALGGVVFAGSGLFSALALALVCTRLSNIVLGLPRAVRWGVGILGGSLLGFAAAVVRTKMAHGSGPSLSTLDSAKLVDGLAFTLSALLASASPLVSRRTLALLGPPLAVVIVVLGVSALFACPVLRDTVEEKAPLFSGLVALVAQH